jgi:hypothetical protein
MAGSPAIAVWGGRAIAAGIRSFARVSPHSNKRLHLIAPQQRAHWDLREQAERASAPTLDLDYEQAERVASKALERSRSTSRERLEDKSLHL